MAELYRVFIEGIGECVATPDPSGQAVASSLLSSKLELVVDRADGTTEYLDLGSGLVTNQATWMLAADCIASTATLKLAKYHDLGTGSTTPTVSDTALATQYGGARSVGTQSTVGNTYITTGSFSFTGAVSITEWGLFTNSTGGTLFDRRTFATQSFNSGDNATWRYQLSINSGV